MLMQQRQSLLLSLLVWGRQCYSVFLALGQLVLLVLVVVPSPTSGFSSSRTSIIRNTCSSSSSSRLLVPQTPPSLLAEHQQQYQRNSNKSKRLSARFLAFTGDMMETVAHNDDEEHSSSLPENKNDTSSIISSRTDDADDNINEDAVLDELVSPEMAFGIATRLGQEGATAFTDLAMSEVVVNSSKQKEMDAVLTVIDDVDSSLALAAAADEGDRVDDAKQEEAEPRSATDDISITAPSVTKILKFAIPAIGVWLCGPLLSLIDTSAVGLLSGTAQQAALNPAVAVTEYAALLIAFMYTATTNLIASSQGADQGVEGMPRTSKKFIAALQLSGVVGTALGSILFCLAVPLLRAIIGNDAIDPAVFFAALKYVRIRALGMPAAAIIGSSQAASLGMQDIKSPLYVLMAAAVINFLGDAMLVGNAHPWIGGAAGAAWATVFSQYAAVALFVRWMCYYRPNTAVAEPRFQIQKLVANHLARRSTRGFLAGKFRARDFFQFPSKEKMADFVPYIVPVTSTQFGRISSYVAMSHVIASSLGTINMAAQQVIISVWNCLYPVGESLSLTAQSFTPGIFETTKGPARTQALAKTLCNFWMAGAVLGMAMFGAVLCIPLINQFFTADPAVISLINSVLPRLLVIFSTLGLFTASEGMLLGQKDLHFLGKSYATFFVVIPLLMLRLKRAALRSSGVVTLKSVWTLFTGYQIFRTSLWVLRAVQLQRRTSREKATADIVTP